MKVLLVEDEIHLSESICEYLLESKIICEPALNFDVAIEKINLHTYDCIIVDIMLPGGSGLEIVKRLKAMQSNSGVIIISAKNSLDDKIAGLDLGADDYLTKPFHLSELNARLKAIVRRRFHEGSTHIEFNEILLNSQSGDVLVNGKLVVLTKKEFQLLLYFISNKNKVLSKESIADHLWGDSVEMADSLDFIYSHVKNLRKKIITAGGADYIKTVYAIGYKFTDL